SVEKGRVAMVLKGARDTRILFLEDEHVLRIVDDSRKMYFDIAKGEMGADGGQMEGVERQLEEAKKQLAQLPPGQREMAEKMMGMNAAGKAKAASPPEYVWTKETQKVAGYECTRVDVMRDGEKHAEYWGTTSPDFRLGDDERAAVVEMQEYLGNSLIKVRG